MMNEKIISENPLPLKMLGKYFPVLLIIVTLVGAKGLWSELKNSYFLIVVFVIFFIAIIVSWFIWIRTNTANYCSVAKQVYMIDQQTLYVSNSNLFQKKTYISIPFELVDSIEYLGHIKRKRVIYYMYAIHLQKTFNNVANPVIFLESGKLSFLASEKPSQQWETIVASTIKKIIGERREN